MRALLLAVAAMTVGPAAAFGEQTASCPPRAEIDAASVGLLNEDRLSLDTFREHAPCYHWVEYYVAAAAMFSLGNRDEAVGWFYVGQMRGRLTAYFGPPDGDAALIASLNSTLGRSFNEYAGGDRDKW